MATVSTTPLLCHPYLTGKKFRKSQSSLRNRIRNNRTSFSTRRSRPSSAESEKVVEDGIRMLVWDSGHQRPPSREPILVRGFARNLCFCDQNRIKIRNSRLAPYFQCNTDNVAHYNVWRIAQSLELERRR